MNMKRIFSLALMALLLCLPVWAMAATYDLSTFVPNDSKNIIFDVSNDDNITLIGTAPSCVHIQPSGLDSGETLTLDSVCVEDGILYLLIPEEGNVTLELKGNNYISTNSNSYDLQIFGKLIVNQRGNLGANGIYAQEGCDMILPDYWPVPTGKRFTGWEIEDGGGISYKQAGEHYTSDSYVIIIPMFEPDGILPPGSGAHNPEIDNLPKTGDDSNVILWSALACISVIGMMTLVRKRKEA